MVNVKKHKNDVIAAYKADFAEFTKAFTRMREAEAAVVLAKKWQRETHVGENEARRLEAEADFAREKQSYNLAKSRAFSNYDAVKLNAMREIKAEIERNSDVNPDAIDSNTLEILKSGICKAKDYAALAERFDSNPTMLKLIAKYADDASKSTDNVKDRQLLSAVSLAAQNGESAAEREWNDFLSNMRHFTFEGQTSPEMIVTMGTQFDNLMSM